MTDQQFEKIVTILNQQTLILERLACAVERSITTNAPNYTRPLESFKTFDWESIGAIVEKSDRYGPAVVSWGGQQFMRRNPSNRFGDAIWFSRCVGKDDAGEPRYDRLITFKPINKEVEPVPDRLARFVK